MSGFAASGGPAACGSAGQCQRGPAKGCPVVSARGMEVVVGGLAESTKRLGGRGGGGGVEIMKGGKPGPLPWFSLWPIMRALDTQEHTDMTHLAAWQIDLGA